MGVASTAIGGLVSRRLAGGLQIVVWLPVTIVLAACAAWLAESEVATVILIRRLHSRRGH